MLSMTALIDLVKFRGRRYSPDERRYKLGLINSLP
jgi:hypothetical protein